MSKISSMMYLFFSFHRHPAGSIFSLSCPVLSSNNLKQVHMPRVHLLQLRHLVLIQLITDRSFAYEYQRFLSGHAACTTYPLNLAVEKQPGGDSIPGVESTKTRVFAGIPSDVEDVNRITRQPFLSHSQQVLCELQKTTGIFFDSAIANAYSKKRDLPGRSKY